MADSDVTDIHLAYVRQCEEASSPCKPISLLVPDLGQAAFPHKRGRVSSRDNKIEKYLMLHYSHTTSCDKNGFSPFTVRYT